METRNKTIDLNTIKTYYICMKDTHILDSFKDYIIFQHKIMNELENKTYSKKLEYERLLYKNSKSKSSDEINKNHKRMMKLNAEMSTLITKRKIISDNLKSKILEYTKKNII